MDELKFGTLVGEDKYGNKYFENNYYFYGTYLKKNSQQMILMFTSDLNFVSYRA